MNAKLAQLCRGNVCEARRGQVEALIDRMGVHEIARRTRYADRTVRAIRNGTENNGRNVSASFLLAMERCGLLAPGAGEGSRPKERPAPALRPVPTHRQCIKAIRALTVADEAAEDGKLDPDERREMPQVWRDMEPVVEFVRAHAH